MTDRELFELVLQKVTSMETNMQEMKTDIKDLKEDVQVLKEDVKALKEDVDVLKEDVKVLKEDVKVLKEDVKVLKKDVQNLKSEQQKTNERLASIEAKQHIMYEQTGKLAEYHIETMARFETVATKADLEYFEHKIAKHERAIFQLQKRA
ncbi:hypothetical protein [Lysinibacillus piscis]|uniref:Uncharacterized protein n=1 Tax=Lysinibacillus piscis TaxID=2518931 RepID=A0ABQ5NLZ2_9BACI|nr:hypothetical protein [Lysinibacillus sp. KH24]GLC89044.1 hypothetical protein LYSBPC_21710 [Lysinibacillus sp. KH24]